MASSQEPKTDGRDDLSKRFLQLRPPNAEPFKKSAFETLPFELRVEIYRMVLTSKEPISRANSKGHTLYPALLACSAQIHDEAACVLYGENTFSLSMFYGGRFNSWGFCGISKHEIMLPQRYQRLIRRVEMWIMIHEDEGELKFESAIQGTASLRRSVSKVAAGLAFNDLKFLKVGYRTSPQFNAVGHDNRGVLEPLLDVRANNFELIGHNIREHMDPALAHKFKHTIEGPRDTASMAIASSSNTTSQQKEKKEPAETEERVSKHERKKQQKQKKGPAEAEERVSKNKMKRLQKQRKEAAEVGGTL